MTDDAAVWAARKRVKWSEIIDYYGKDIAARDSALDAILAAADDRIKQAEASWHSLDTGWQVRYDALTAERDRQIRYSMALDQSIDVLVRERDALQAAVEQACPEVEKILALANGLSNRLKGTPDMYEANKIMHAAWAIQAALTASTLKVPTETTRRQVASVLTVHYGTAHACAVEDLVEILGGNST